MANATTAPPATMAAPPAAASERIPPRRLIAFLIMVFGMFMSILDIQVVSASLSEIQAGLSASSSEVSWVQTAYLIAEVIAIPLSGFLSRALGTRILFAISAAGFTIASFLCGFASSIEQPEIRLVEIDQRQHADGDADAGNDVDEEQPVPGHGVGDEAAHRRTDGWRQRCDQTDDRADDVEF